MLIGQEALQQRLLGQLRADRTVHAYLISGPAGSGKRTLAAWWAQTLLCRDPQKNGGCGKCPACIRVQSGNHPDLLRIRVEKGEAAGVGTARMLVEELPVRPYEGGKKILIIEDADLLTVQAQNALLKSLEEPPLYARFILTASNIQSILPTVRSRCSIIRTVPVGEKPMAALLKEQGMDPLRIAAACAQSQGSVGQALAFCKDETLYARRTRAAEMLEQLLEEKQTSIPRLVGIFRKERSEAIMILDAWHSLIEDALVARVGAKQRMNPDFGGLVDKMARLFTTRTLKGMINEVYRTRAQIFGNANAAMAAERMLARIVEEM